MSTNVIEPLAVTVDDAAAMLGVSDRTIFSLISEGQLASIQIGSARRVPVDALRKIARTGASLPTVTERTAKRTSKQLATA